MTDKMTVRFEHVDAMVFVIFLSYMVLVEVYACFIFLYFMVLIDVYTYWSNIYIKKKTKEKDKSGSP